MVRTRPPATLADDLLSFIEEEHNRFEDSKKARIRAIQAGRAAGLTWQQMGDRMGLHHTTVLGLAKRAEK